MQKENDPLNANVSCHGFLSIVKEERPDDSEFGFFVTNFWQICRRMRLK